MLNKWQLLLAISDWLPKSRGNWKAMGTRLTSMEEQITREDANYIYLSLIPAEDKCWGFPGYHPWATACCISHALWRVMTPRPWVPALLSGPVSPRFLQAPQIQRIPNLMDHLTLSGSPNLLPQCALGWCNPIIISASPRLLTLSQQPSANLPHTSSVTKSY